MMDRSGKIDQDAQDAEEKIKKNRRNYTSQNERIKPKKEILFQKRMTPRVSGVERMTPRVSGVLSDLRQQLDEEREARRKLQS